ncbi:hypothetical protein HJFPF1_05947 [Paramyrothecium foliicola]|nr:hypothetical protein HJFPF1_05947 [Paramyrothecium foliicola]
MKVLTFITLLAGSALATPVENVQAAPAAEVAQSVEQAVGNVLMAQIGAGKAFCLPGCFDWCFPPLDEEEHKNCPDKFKCCYEF